MSTSIAKMAGAALVASSLFGGVAHAELKAGGAYNSLHAGLGAKGYDVVNYFADGKLYLNFNADIQKVFDKDPAGFISRANANWPKL